MRALLCLLLLAGCSAPVSKNGAQVDLNGAADRAQENTGANQQAAMAAPTPPDSHAPAIVHARYRCMDGTKIALRRDSAANTVALSRDGKPLATLSDRRPAAGFRYANDLYDLQGQGEMATVSAPGLPPIVCKAID